MAQALPRIVPGLYQIAVPPPGANAGSPGVPDAYAYFLTQADTSPAPTITLDTIWSDLDLAGWYVFLTAPIAGTDAAALVNSARSGQLPALYAGGINPRTLVWLDEVSPISVVAYLPLYQIGMSTDPLIRTPAQRRKGTPYTFDWTPLTMNIASSVNVGYSSTDAALIMTTIGNTRLITLLSGGAPGGWYDFYPEDGYSWALGLALGGDSVGGFRTRLGLDFQTLVTDFGCGMRYGVDHGADGVAALDFPLYALPSSPQTAPGFILHLHPLLPVTPQHTRFSLDFGDASPVNAYQAAAATLRASSYLTTTGRSITLAPCSPQHSAGIDAPPGFAFCVNPPTASSPGADGLYLAPLGLHRVTAIDTVAGSSDIHAAQWMCGLSGLEYLDLHVADLLAFEPGMPAFMPFEPSQDAALDHTCTTAWLRYPVTPATPGYFGQPSASVYFGSVVDGAFAQPVQARLATLSAAATPFPMPPYGLTGSNGQGGQNASLGASIARLEAGALTGLRHARLTSASPGPIFGPSASLLEAHDATLTPTAETPQGFLVRLNTGADAGSWKEVEFAQSPDQPGQRLALCGGGSPGIVPKAIATQLMQDQLFMVISDASALGSFANEIAIEGFNFRLAVGSGGVVDDSSTILIFKYNSKMALQDLALNPGLWAASDVFVTDAANTLDQIRRALAAAAPSSPSVAGGDGTKADPFAHFRSIAADPGWTGLIALNCEIDGNGMPLDLQMLLGGIDGQLFAHHFGVQSNRLTHSDGYASIDESSLFGVISYPSKEHPKPPPDTQDDFAYVLEQLTVVLLNSNILDFTAMVGLTVNRLFGRSVTLMPANGSPPDNTLSIPGHYQLQDGIATVTFVSGHPFCYQFPALNGAARVLQQVLFNSAALTPVSGGAASPSLSGDAAQQVRSRFSLAGAMWFNSAPFAGAAGFDLFSFGTAPLTAIGNGLAFDGLAVDIVTTLDASGGAGSTTVSGDLSAFSCSATRQAIRHSSLLAGMPLQLSRFISVEQGYSAASRGATAVHVLQLEPSEAASASSPFLGAGSPQLSAASTAPNVTQTPQYGLEFDLPLGSLGALSNASVGLMAKLVIGWGASSLVPDTDAAAVMVQLPQAFAGYGSFQLQGILKTVFGAANLLMVELDDGSTTYALLFNNVQLSVMGYNFPAGRVIDFLLFAGGASADGVVGDDKSSRNVAWFLGSADQVEPSP